MQMRVDAVLASVTLPLLTGFVRRSEPRGAPRHEGAELGMLTHLRPRICATSHADSAQISRLGRRVHPTWPCDR